MTRPAAAPTPGPWMLDEYQSGGGYGLSVPACAVMCSRNNKVICEIPEYTQHEDADADRANAKLIAAAPDLRDALRGLLAAASLSAAEGIPFVPNSPGITEARAALAKAGNP